ncbi:hypothetical protein M407DRAFT_33747 [Tulasnella calospora MUT 4182]|uniref:Uncharacterized protein n=1 Tax=Tulasnella calospora MUT 4182 TaxID=1051891 RepID=A0A0C3L4R5_9AGAM|nr:hypothetical protein M407DRAFT_33747 [Tulasnella calospora MUT 4182]
MDAEQDCLFTGTGDFTCHQFIRSVRELALKAQKQRDDDWMADNASILFDGEALKWFESLDDDVQTDWKRLRRALLARFAQPAYEEAPPRPDQNPQHNSMELKGESESECQEFVSQIRKRAVAEGKENDSEWMVRLAFPCFLGKALKWHASLSIDVQSSWRCLERAILLDFPHTPTSVISPARIQVNDWYSFVPPSSSLQSIRSHTDWINQARERRKIYELSNNKSIPCWLLIESQKDIPNNAIRTGTDVSGNPLYSVRSWYKDVGLLVGKCGPHLSGGAYVALNSEEISKIYPFEILVGDPSHFKWVAIPEKPKDERAVAPSPFIGVEAGLENGIRHRATFITQIWLDNSWQPGKVHSGDLAKNERSAFVFTGKDKEECRAFIREIRLRASEEGKDDDSSWKHRLASPCFAGNALEWHASLPQDVRNSWHRLEKAVLVDYPLAPLQTISPARIFVEKWSISVPPSASLQHINAREDWICQATERRRMYREVKDNSTPCWLLVETEKDIPEVALITGFESSGEPLYSARAWVDGKGLIVGKCGRHISGAGLPINSIEIQGVTPFEVLVGDPSHFYWVAVLSQTEKPNPITHQPFAGVDAGVEMSNRHRATFISQFRHEGDLCPGKIHSTHPTGEIGKGGQEHWLETHNARLLAWAN